ncbi:amino acid adenylation domain-containing protein [Bordetella sp. LUAb4]|uniref:non-ribosomal peptide synthetase n=1 Tax=Bordetella sp. LUAb4 TaxID=2843195 RepID=UPI001E449C81|nr:amino acid adenylation domain-containing protein [Bordetella sp. LUAb4]
MNTLSARLAPAQALLWDGGDMPLPCVGASFVLGRPLDAARLALACHDVAHRHEAFSAIFDPLTLEISTGTQPRVDIDVRQVADDGVSQAPDSAPGDLGAGPMTGPMTGPLLRVVLERAQGGVRRITVSACALVCDRIGLYRYVQQALLRYEAGPGLNAGEAADEALPYVDFLDWRATLAEEPVRTAGQQYWQACQDAIGPHPHRVDAPFLRPPAGSRQDVGQGGCAAYSSHHHSIDARIMAALGDSAERAGVAVDALLHVAWYVLLARLSGEYRLAYAWLHDGRQDYDVLRDAVGAFERIMPVLGDATPDDKVDDVARRFDAVLQAHRAWAEQIEAPATVSALGCGVGFSVVSVPVVGQPSPVAAHPAAPTCAASIPAAYRLHGLDLLGSVVIEASGAAKLEFHYVPASAGDSWIQTLAAQYAQLLDGLAQQRDGAIGDLALEDNATLRARRLTGNATDEVEGGIDAWIAHWSRIAPHRVALRYRDTSLTYAELNAQVDRVADGLAASGVGAGDRVALLAPRSPELVAGLMGVLRAGAAYVPLDGGWPLDRIVQILAQSQARLVLAEAALGGRLGGAWPGPCVNLKDLLLAPAPQVPPQASRQPSRQSVAGHDAAYVMFTSGSTGTPKGVVVEHRQIMAYTGAVSAGLALQPCRVYGWTATVAADLGNTALFGAFYHGATLAVADAEESVSAMAFQHFLREKQIDCLKIVPSHLDALLTQSAPLALGTVILGGEPIPDGMVGKLRALDGDVRIYNHYGPTETTIGVLFHAFERTAQGADRGPSPLTRAMDNCQAFLVNRRGGLAAAGEVGELYVTGRQLARGYLTNDSGGFVERTGEGAPRCYRTGDLGCYLPQGGLVLCGRMDTQVKIRGYRVEPEEIAAVLRRMPGVSQAIVIAAVTDGTPARLAAFVVADDDAQGYLTGKFLRAELSRGLPDHMVPAWVECIGVIPRLPNGKVDQRQLAQRVSAPSGDSRHVPPNDALARLLVEVAESLLEAPGLSLDDDFFECGGDSIAAIRYAAELGARLERHIMPAAIFTHRTFRELGAFLREGTETATGHGLTQEVGAH